MQQTRTSTLPAPQNGDYIVVDARGFTGFAKTIYFAHEKSGGEPIPQVLVWATPERLSTSKYPISSTSSPPVDAYDPNQWVPVGLPVMEFVFYLDTLNGDAPQHAAAYRVEYLADANTLGRLSVVGDFLD